ncbi:class I SAM-dependent methyltransferase [Halioglobus pacificus]|uniref:Uncharacterized protein n=1 Tax=Parahalioglobus pacificus TaxID=930806 RepID=A0A919CKG7_9GAMM|nr:class I SAM-dependent methyltransferase [Halioglobus pacificus]GHD33715.1 hypothetical protein GCM10007053_18420 [Halioglobus pacificus]
MKAGFYHSTKHLTEEQLHAASAECVICGSRELKRLSDLQKNPSVFLLRCETCSCISASRLPTQAALNAYYATYYDHEVFETAEEAVTFHDIESFAKRISKVVEPYLNGRTLNILDFGGGSGALSKRFCKLHANKGKKTELDLVDYSLARRSYDLQGIAVSEYATIEDLLKNLNNEKSKYDLVLASAVLEHLPNPTEALRQLSRLLRKGGVLYIRTPTVYPIMHTLSKVNVSVDFTFPAHIHDMGEEFWRYYFTELAPHSMRVIVSRPSPVETSFRGSFFRTLAAHVLKFPWRLLGKHYTLVGGWEVFARKSQD